MLRLLLRSLAINFAGIYILFQLLSGVIVFYGGFSTLVCLAVLVSLSNLLVKPLVNLLLLPIHLVTMGLFRWISNLVTLYLITVFFPGFKIHSFVSSRFDLVYVIVPSIHFSVFGAFLLVALAMAVVFHFLYWLLQD
jgi:putative membrane protein